MLSYGEQIKQEVTSWDGVSANPHRFGGTEFNLGKVEIGHVHGDRLVDIPFTKRIRDALVAEGEAQAHHILPETGWISFYLRQDADVAQAIRLLKLSYLYKRARRHRDVAHEQYASLHLSENLKTLVLSDSDHAPDEL